MVHPKSGIHIDVWSIEGDFEHWVFSPKGDIEGLLMLTDGVPTQFVIQPGDPALTRLCRTLQRGRRLVVEGTLAEHPGKDEPPHTVYELERVVSVDGEALGEPASEEGAEGIVVRFNYARHGAPNGVLLDSGDFVHTRPGGLAALGLRLGDQVKAVGPSRGLATGAGRVIEARRVNGRPVAPRH